MSAADAAVLGRDIRKHFRRATGEVVNALDGVSLAVRPGTLAALVGPDGAGKTTFIRLVAGLMRADGGTLQVLGLDAATEPQAIQDRIAYMPQRFGLYEDLTVAENIDLYASLHGVSAAERAERYPQLYEMTALGPFTHRQAGQLSGGMKQKLGLACTLVRAPGLLLLDEPTVGVDPLSRRELWQIIHRLVQEHGLTVLMSTSYLDEAERCDDAFVLREGKLLASGPPGDVTRLADGRTFEVPPAPGEPARALQARLFNEPGIVDAVPRAGRVHLVRAETGAGPGPYGLTATPAHFEDGFMVLLRGTAGGERPGQVLPPGGTGDVSHETSAEIEIEVRDLVRKFGAFTAVDRVNFRVRRGEIFGLLGPNGAGKTTTFRMLCGLLPATSGTLRVAGPRPAHRTRIGAPAYRLRGAEILALLAALGRREPGFFRERLWLARGEAARAHRMGARRVRAEAAPSPRERAIAGRLQAAPGHGGRAAARAADPVPRRADERRRPLGAARVLAAHHGARRGWRHGRRHHAFHGRGRILRRHRHPRCRPRAGRRDAGRGAQPRAAG